MKKNSFKKVMAMVAAVTVLGITGMTSALTASAVDFVIETEGVDVTDIGIPVEISVSVDDNAGLTNFGLMIEYDSALEYVGKTDSKDTPFRITQTTKNNRIFITSYTDTNNVYKQNGELLVLEFKLPATAKAGDTFSIKWVAEGDSQDPNYRINVGDASRGAGNEDIKAEYSPVDGAIIINDVVTTTEPTTVTTEPTTTEDPEFTGTGITEPTTPQSGSDVTYVTTEDPTVSAVTTTAPSGSSVTTTTTTAATTNKTPDTGVSTTGVAAAAMAMVAAAATALIIKKKKN